MDSPADAASWVGMDLRGAGRLAESMEPEASIAEARCTLAAAASTVVAADSMVAVVAVTGKAWMMIKSLVW